MKILLLADPASTHTIKWANGLAENGLEVFIFGLSKFTKELFNKDIKIYSLSHLTKYKYQSDGTILKLTYLLSLNQLKKIIKEFKPDIIHAHYASSYGLLGALTGFHPYIISVWGSDIYNFPGKSFLHKSIIQFSFGKADKILSTSKTMALQVSHFTSKDIEVLPFGIDTEKFKSSEVKSLFSKDSIVVGTIKSLEKKYGIDFLIKAFTGVKRRLFLNNLKLLIVGGGSQEQYLKKLVNDLGIRHDTIFTGFISPDRIPEYHNMIDIYAALSMDQSESFGVAIIEASACEKPVIVNRVGGLTEVAENNVTGLFVEPGNIEDAAVAIEKLIYDKPLRVLLGKNGRQKVLDEYTWQSSVDKMIKVYSEVLNKK